MNIVGLSMTMNEEDIIEESFSVHCKYYDQIVVMDNSTDRTPEILTQFPQVVKIFKQKHIFGHQRVWDGMRGVLLRYINDELNGADWISLVHADEIFVDDPIKAVEMAEKEQAECIWWKFAQFYFHETERDSIHGENINIPVQKRRLWYSVNWCEPRIFRNKKGLFYDPYKNSHTIPHGVNVHNKLEATPLLKHYTFRSYNQSVSRIEERKDLQPYYTKSEGINLFKTHCPHGILLKRFSGSFGIYDNSLENLSNRRKGWNYSTQEEFRRCEQ
jgi:hypothetical protein